MHFYSEACTATPVPRDGVRQPTVSLPGSAPDALRFLGDHRPCRQLSESEWKETGHQTARRPTKGGSWRCADSKPEPRSRYRRLQTDTTRGWNLLIRDRFSMAGSRGLVQSNHPRHEHVTPWPTPRQHGAVFPGRNRQQGKRQRSNEYLPQYNALSILAPRGAGRHHDAHSRGSSDEPARPWSSPES